MWTDGLVNSGAMPALEMTLRFAGQRQTLIANNIANLDTPNYLPKDVSVTDFRRTLGEAIDRRRQSGRGESPLPWDETRELRRDRNGELRIEPRTPSQNIVFHDRNNRDLERTMQDLAENAMAFRVSAELLRGRMEILRAAIAQRP